MEEHLDTTGPRKPSLEDFERARALPPPAFPPGFRRVSVRRRLERHGRKGSVTLSGEGAIGRSTFPDGAFISPEEPIARPLLANPYISPDEPIPHRPLRPTAEEDETLGPDDVLVTGMGDDAHLEPEQLGLTDDPDVVALTEQVVALAEALRFRGEDGLWEHPGISRFEATLRSYCRGYLDGRRKEEGRA
jgi:hypothetical protein